MSKRAYMKATVYDGMFSGEKYAHVACPTRTAHMFLDESFVHPHGDKVEVIVVSSSDTLSLIRFPVDPLNTTITQIVPTSYLEGI